MGRISSETTATGLPAIAPHLILKREQAELLLEALALKETQTPGHERYAPRDVVAYHERMLCIYESIREANTRGRTLEVDAVTAG